MLYQAALVRKKYNRGRVKETSRIYSNRHITCADKYKTYILYTWCRVYIFYKQTNTHKKTHTHTKRHGPTIAIKPYMHHSRQTDSYRFNHHSEALDMLAACICLLQQKALLSFKNLRKRQSSSIMTTIHVRKLFPMCNLSVGTVVKAILHIHKSSI